MAKRKKKKGRMINIIIIVLTLMIIAVVGIMTVFIYNYFTKPANIPGTESEEEITTPEETTSESETTTSESIVITKQSTTKPEANEEITETSTTNEAPSADLAYKPEFYENDLFIGDSISTGLSGYGYLEAENVFAQVGLNPSTALEKEINGITISDKLTAMQPERVYIMLGSNGIAFLDGSYMCEQLTSLIELINKLSPNSKVVIISIPPVTKAHDQEGEEKMADINAYNDELEQLASTIGCTYIDICTLLKDENGYFSEDYAEADGMHFLGKTYVTMLNYIETSIEAEE